MRGSHIFVVVCRMFVPAIMQTDQDGSSAPRPWQQLRSRSVESNENTLELGQTKRNKGRGGEFVPRPAPHRRKRREGHGIVLLCCFFYATITSTSPYMSRPLCFSPSRANFSSMGVRS